MPKAAYAAMVKEKGLSGDKPPLSKGLGGWGVPGKKAAARFMQEHRPLLKEPVEGKGATDDDVPREGVIVEGEGLTEETPTFPKDVVEENGSGEGNQPLPKPYDRLRRWPRACSSMLTLKESL